METDRERGESRPAAAAVAVIADEAGERFM